MCSPFWHVFILEFDQLPSRSAFKCFTFVLQFQLWCFKPWVVLFCFQLSWYLTFLVVVFKVSYRQSGLGFEVYGKITLSSCFVFSLWCWNYRYMLHLAILIATYILIHLTVFHTHCHSVSRSCFCLFTCFFFF